MAILSIITFYTICLLMEAVKENPIKTIPAVDISPQGIFKYILIFGYEEHNGKKDLVPHQFVRGDKSLEYHKNNFQKFMKEVKNAGFEIKKKNANEGTFQAIKGNALIHFTCQGGGRIEHNYQGKKCFIYGYSQSYGRVDHTIAQERISQALKYDINEIQTSPQGY